MTVRILTLNINGYGDKYGSWEKRKPLIAAEIHKHGADIVALQAAERRRELHDGIDQASQLQKLLPEMESCTFYPATHTAGRELGNAILAKFPFHGRVVLLPAENAEDPLVRLVVIARFETPFEFNVLNCHFSGVEQQNRKNLEYSRPVFDDFCVSSVALGDFNAPPDGAVCSYLEGAGWTDAWEQLHRGDAGKTFAADRPSTRIDYVWLSPDLSRNARRLDLVGNDLRGAVRLSDHFGLCLTLEESTF